MKEERSCYVELPNQTKNRSKTKNLTFAFVQKVLHVLPAGGAKDIKLQLHVQMLELGDCRDRIPSCLDLEPSVMRNNPGQVPSYQGLALEPMKYCPIALINLCTEVNKIRKVKFYQRQKLQPTHQDENQRQVKVRLSVVKR